MPVSRGEMNQPNKLIDELNSIINMVESVEIAVKSATEAKVEPSSTAAPVARIERNADEDAAFQPEIPQGHTKFSWLGRAAPPPAPVKKKVEGRDRRDHLIEIERDMQALWAREKVFESEPKPGQEKYMITFPYPYMNGYLHVGHAFTFAKAEFAAGYQRLKGKNVLWGFGFHCTGMPIQAAAMRLDSEMKQYGDPPNFPKDDEEAKSKQAAKKGKGKAAHKKSKATYQWQIMKEYNLEDSQIGAFRDSRKWLEYFPPIGKKHLQMFGAKIDWRRSFITTSVNPYYNSFVEWQFRHLHQKGYIDFGKRPAIFSPAEDQACGDNDRAEGEGVGPQEQVMLKFKLIDEPTVYTEKHGDKLKPLFQMGHDVFLVAITLRPETMYGQTNLFVLPRGDYIAIETTHGIFITAENAARNLAFQDLTPTPKKYEIIQKIEGWELLGRKVVPPNCIKYDFVYVLPLLTIKMTKGSGLVSSVPSDAPDDWAALMDIKKDAKARDQYYISKEMVESFDVVEIIEIDHELYKGVRIAADLCKKAKVKNQHQVTKLKEIKDTAYKLGFNFGKMLVGEFKGMRVKDAKVKVKEQMVRDGLAIIYYEPEDKVVSRTGDLCVVALTEQWFLKYGMDGWREQVAKHVENMELYNPRVRVRFETAVGWLKEWACSRRMGLGTFLPWDKKWVIEALSDSTIYWAYYTVCHKLQSAALDGSIPGKIKGEDMNDDVWEYIFRQGPYPKACTIAESLLKELREEFEYWYPMDVRVSGKDLIGNHLTMAIYNHVAIWDDAKMWPQSYFCNGHTMLNNEKMSKSTGNFRTLEDVCIMFSADATRLALADAGDGIEDANFVENVANKNILNLTTEERWMTSVCLDKSVPLRSGPYNNLDLLFANAISRCVHEADKAYTQMKYRAALLAAWFQLQNAKKFYVDKSKIIHGELIHRFIEEQLIIFSPICTHFCESMWQRLGKPGLIVNASWPEARPVDPVLSSQYAYLLDLCRDARKKLDSEKDARQRAKLPDTSPVSFEILVSSGYLDWQEEILGLLDGVFKKNKDDFINSWRKPFMKHSLITSIKKSGLSKKDSKKRMNELMSFAQYMAQAAVDRGESALAIKTLFDEEVFLKDMVEVLSQALGLDPRVLVIRKVSKSDRGAKPMAPVFGCNWST